MRLTRMLIPLTAVLLIAAKPISATTSFQFSVQGSEIQQPVEQQTPGWLLPCPLTETICRFDQTLWVTNPTGMPWDVDDHMDRAAMGSLGSATTVTDNLSYTADCDGGQCGPYRFVVVRASVAAPSLQMSVVITPGQNGGQDNYAASAPTWNPTTKKWDYYFCQKTPSYPDSDPRLQLIANSNGGMGVPTSLVLTVTNSGKTLRNAYVTWGLDAIAAGVCPAS